MVGVHTGLRAFWALTSLVAASLPLPLSPRALSPFEADDDQCFIHDHSFLEERQGKRRGRQRPHQEAVLQIVSSLLRMAHVARMPRSESRSRRRVTSPRASSWAARAHAGAAASRVVGIACMVIFSDFVKGCRCIHSHMDKSLR